MPVTRYLGLFWLRPCAYSAAVAIVSALAILSLLPAILLWRTGVGSYTEHFVAYTFATAMLFALFSERRRPAILLGMLVLAGLLECLQHFSPGRTPDFPTFLYSCAGSLSAAFLVNLRAWRAPGTQG